MTKTGVVYTTRFVLTHPGPSTAGNAYPDTLVINGKDVLTGQEFVLMERYVMKTQSALSHKVSTTTYASVRLDGLEMEKLVVQTEILTIGLTGTYPALTHQIGQLKGISDVKKIIVLTRLILDRKMLTVMEQEMLATTMLTTMAYQIPPITAHLYRIRTK